MSAPSRLSAVCIFLAASPLLAPPASVAGPAEAPNPVGPVRVHEGGAHDPALSRIDFATGSITPWRPDRIAPRLSTEGAPGEAAGQALILPATGPVLAVRGSRFSPVMRARDLFDIEAYPARAVAKLFRLTADGARQGTACTAQFVGPRHLLTAAHCLVDRTTGRPHSGFEIALRHDGGRDDGVAPVTAAWAPTSETTQRPSVVLATGPIDWAADCHDIALIEIAEPAGRRLGWLGMSTTAVVDQVLHRFSYPNESTATLAQRHLDTLDQPDEETLQREQAYIATMKLTEPDFSPDNLYYEFGPADRIQQEALSERNGAVLPGRSGSALMDGQGNVLGIMSRAVSGSNYSCRLTPELVGIFADLSVASQ